jgi:hypothetical protein
MAKSLPPEINYTIIKIKEVFFHLNEKLFIASGGQHPFFILQHKLDILKEEQKLVLTLKAAFYYGQEYNNENSIASTEVENHFFIQEFEELLTDNENIQLPNDLWITFVSLSITHTRALFANNLSNTAMSQILLPIVNPTEVTLTFFPGMRAAFEQQKKENKKLIASNPVKRSATKGNKNKVAPVSKSN